MQDKMKVVEYSELPQDMANNKDSHGKLLFGAANICNHYLSMDFLQNTVKDHLEMIKYHKADKKIPYYNIETGEEIKPTEPNGIKLELFIFDIFPAAKKFLVFEVSER